jgi:dolichol-phosphate mannosyltransferase
MEEAVETSARDPICPDAPPLLSVIVPTLNERDNIPEVLRRLDAVLSEISWEVIFVDDGSRDGTLDVIRDHAARDARVRCLRRIGRRGLAGACIEGMLASSAPYVAVMDADLQHDASLLAQMFTLLEEDRADLVVGSRYASGGSIERFSGPRAQGSRAANRIACRLLGLDLADLMSGFFMIRRERFETLAPGLSIHGFKILLDIIATARGGLRVAELPYAFGARLHGDSKFDSLIVLDFIGLVLAKLTRDALSPRFVLFALVGAAGLVVHLAALYSAIFALQLTFAQGQTVAAIVAMTSNFMLNNELTYRDQRLTGVAFLRGLAAFCLLCSIGVIANVGVAFSLYSERPVWWLAGAAGALMGVVWNYVMSSLFVWRTP